jgi:hypothetical protein
MLARFLVATGLLLAPACVVAQTPAAMRTGNELLDTCERDDPPYMMLCIGWVAGATQAFIAAGIAVERQIVCLPTGGTTGQYRDIIVAYLRAHPAERHWPSGGLAFLALKEAFPCRISN